MIFSYLCCEVKGKQFTVVVLTTDENIQSKFSKKLAHQNYIGQMQQIKLWTNVPLSN